MGTNPGRVLVTGATGKTGTELMRVLQEHDVPFSGGVRRLDPTRGHPEVLFDWDDRATWPAALAGISSVYLVKPTRDPGPSIAALLEATPRLERVVLMSEMGRGSKPSTDPERQAELAVEAAGVPWTLLRPSWFFQNFSAVGAYGEPIRTRRAVVLPSGDGRFSLIDTRDVARAAFVALTSSDVTGVAVTLTGPRAWSMAELASLLSAATGRRIVHESTPLEQCRAELVRTGVGAARLHYVMDLYADALADVFSAVTDDVPRMTGYPSRTLEQFVAEHVDYWASPVP